MPFSRDALLARARYQGRRDPLLVLWCGVTAPRYREPGDMADDWFLDDWDEDAFDDDIWDVTQVDLDDAADGEEGADWATPDQLGGEVLRT